MSKNDWAEDLPAGCPPADARRPEGETYYRLVETQSPTLEDFDSQRKKYPHKKFSVDECTVRSASLFSDKQAAIDIMKIGKIQEKKIAEIALPADSGCLKKTSRNPHHWSWWRAANFDPLPNCKIVKYGD